MGGETKFTAAPWFIEGSGIRAVVRGADLTIVAVRHRLPREIHEANFRLIAAAPELYEACAAAVTRNCIGTLQDGTHFFRDNDTSRRAIALIIAALAKVQP